MKYPSAADRGQDTAELRKELGPVGEMLLDAMAEMIHASEARILAAIAAKAPGADDAARRDELISAIGALGDPDTAELYFSPEEVLQHADLDARLSAALSALNIKDARRLGAMLRSIVKTDHRLKRSGRHWQICT